MRFAHAVCRPSVWEGFQEMVKRWADLNMHRNKRLVFVQLILIQKDYNTRESLLVPPMHRRGLYFASYTGFGLACGGAMHRICV